MSLKKKALILSVLAIANINSVQGRTPCIDIVNGKNNLPCYHGWDRC